MMKDKRIHYESIRSRGVPGGYQSFHGNVVINYVMDYGFEEVRG